MRGQTPSISSEMPHLSASFEPEIDDYLDLDQALASSSSTSIEIKPERATEQSRLGISTIAASSQQTFSGPSFQYENHRQQTGIPAGGLANTFALNQATGMQYTGYGNGFVMPIETLNVPLTNLDEFDFAAYPPMDIDLEAEMPTDDFLLSPAPPATSGSGFVDTNMLLGHEQPPAAHAGAIQRMYPGMHSRLAAQAKAQQAQKRNKAAQLPQALPAGQRSLSDTSSSQHTKDPHLEESISRLLSQMRQSSVGSANDEAATPTADLSGLAKLKKDEDDMDEDERLLASEEGKKLSSKERRQLRNKVSARAFRSRRKEYIGQLEGEVAVKTQEAHDLKVRNQELVEENTRLTELTRMLLSSQAFSGFLNELSGNGNTATPNNTQQSQSQLPSKLVNKDVNPNKVARQRQGHRQQAGKATAADASADNWNVGLGVNFPVYSLISLPEGPALDLENLSGKLSQGRVLDTLPNTLPISKPDMPIIESLRPLFGRADDSPTAPSINTDSESGSSDVQFPLYSVSCRSPSTSTAVPFYLPAYLPLGEKERTPFHLVLPTNQSDMAATARLQTMCSRLDAISARISAVIPHLD